MAPTTQANMFSLCLPRRNQYGEAMNFLDSPIFDDAQRDHDTPPDWDGPELDYSEEDDFDDEDEDLDDEDELDIGELLIEVFDYDKGEIDAEELDSDEGAIR